MRSNIFPTVAAVTWLPVAETKNVRREANCARDVRSQASRISMTWSVSGSLRLRLPLDQTMSMCPASRSTCPVCRARVSPVRSPHECISVKNATACHRHGDGVCSLCGGGEEQLDLTAGQQVGVGGNERGFPPVGQHVGVGGSRCIAATGRSRGCRTSRTGSGPNVPAGR